MRFHSLLVFIKHNSNHHYIAVLTLKDKRWQIRKKEKCLTYILLEVLRCRDTYCMTNDMMMIILPVLSGHRTWSAAEDRGGSRAGRCWLSDEPLFTSLQLLEVLFKQMSSPTTCVVSASHSDKHSSLVQPQCLWLLCHDPSGVPSNCACLLSTGNKSTSAKCSLYCLQDPLGTWTSSVGKKPVNTCKHL